MAPSKESKAIRKLREKVKEKIQLETKAMSLRTLNRVRKIIQLQHAEESPQVKKKGRPRKHTKYEIINNLREKVIKEVHEIADSIKKITNKKQS